jgi:hypothetical protein
MMISIIPPPPLPHNFVPAHNFMNFDLQADPTEIMDMIKEQIQQLHDNYDAKSDPFFTDIDEWKIRVSIPVNAIDPYPMYPGDQNGQRLFGILRLFRDANGYTVSFNSPHAILNYVRQNHPLVQHMLPNPYATPNRSPRSSILSAIPQFLTMFDPDGNVQGYYDEATADNDIYGFGKRRSKKSKSPKKSKKSSQRKKSSKKSPQRKKSSKKSPQRKKSSKKSPQRKKSSKKSLQRKKSSKKSLQRKK